MKQTPIYPDYGHEWMPELSDELYRFHTGGPIGGGVVTYTVNGKQYVAVSSGDPSILNWRLDHTGSPTVLIFALPE